MIVPNNSGAVSNSGTCLSSIATEKCISSLRSTSGCGGSSCNDNDPCTTDTRDPLSGCVHTPRDCDDGNSCTMDTCVPTFFSSTTPFGGGGFVAGICRHRLIGCDEGFFCSGEETCVERICRATTFDCDDGVGCVLLEESSNGVCDVLCDVENCAPVALFVFDDPTGNISAPFGSTVCLNGAPSFDVDGDVLSFNWTQLSTPPPTVVLSNPDTPEPCFVAPPEGPSIRFLLTVNDGNGGSDATGLRVSFFRP